MTTPAVNLYAAGAILAALLLSFIAGRCTGADGDRWEPDPAVHRQMEALQDTAEARRIRADSAVAAADRARAVAARDSVRADSLERLARAPVVRWIERVDTLQLADTAAVRVALREGAAAGRACLLALDGCALARASLAVALDSADAAIRERTAEAWGERERADFLGGYAGDLERELSKMRPRRMPWACMATAAGEGYLLTTDVDWRFQVGGGVLAVVACARDGGIL